MIDQGQVKYGSGTPPVFAVPDAVFERRIAEMVFTIEAAGTLRKSRIELIHCCCISSFPVL